MRRVGILVVAGAAFAVAVGLAVARAGERAGALSDWQALVLGIVQGLTELLPISSSGHLILVPWLFEWEFLEANDEFNQTFDVALHLGTLVAVVGYFRRRLARSPAGLAQQPPPPAASLRRTSAWPGSWSWRPSPRPSWALSRRRRSRRTSASRGRSPSCSPSSRSCSGSPTAAPPAGRSSDLDLKAAAGVGLAQTLALAPGVSRSGITISAARFLGLGREAAANFSFLLLVPITFGAVFWKGLTDVVFGDLPAGWVGPFVVGTMASAVSGLVAIWALLGYVRRHDYTLFVVYRLAVAAFVLLLIATGVRPSTF